MTDTARVLVRMPPALHALLKADAARRGESVNTLIVGLLKGTRRPPQGGDAIAAVHAIDAVQSTEPV